ncbi:MAG: hypothetical protein KC656_23840 [Myxococcales bacterium]|nr:hypothetical protein [Myxococcales bacterium]MCB9663490.1 hypothetical protein [Alphaproteobacteria bacterium]
MATFEATTHPMTFAHMEGEVKTVYVVPRSSEYDHVSSGDRIEFEPLGSITIGAIRAYDDLPALLEGEGITNVVPDAETVDAAIEALRAGPEWNKRVEESRGVLALRVRATKRKT